jgi:hypothetical protein
MTKHHEFKLAGNTLRMTPHESHYAVAILTEEQIREAGFVPREELDSAMHALEGIVNKYSRKVAALEKVAEAARTIDEAPEGVSLTVLCIDLNAAIRELDALDAAGEDKP